MRKTDLNSDGVSKKKKKSQFEDAEHPFSQTLRDLMYNGTIKSDSQIPISPISSCDETVSQLTSTQQNSQLECIAENPEEEEKWFQASPTRSRTISLYSLVDDFITVDQKTLYNIHS